MYVDLCQFVVNIREVLPILSRISAHLEVIWVLLSVFCCIDSDWIFVDKWTTSVDSRRFCVDFYWYSVRFCLIVVHLLFAFVWSLILLKLLFYFVWFGSIALHFCRLFVSFCLIYFGFCRILPVFVSILVYFFSNLVSISLEFWVPCCRISIYPIVVDFCRYLWWYFQFCVFYCRFLFEFWLF